MTRNRQAKRWGSPTHTNTHERGKLNSADVGSLTNRAPNQKETTCMALHRGGSFETHEDNLAVFAAEKACHDRCHLDVVFFFSHDAHARSRSSFARSESYATCETTQLPDLELCDGQIVYMVMASSCLRPPGLSEPGRHGNEQSSNRPLKT